MTSELQERGGDAPAPAATGVRGLARLRRPRAEPPERLDVVGHFDELRRRLFVTLGTILGTAVVTFVFHADLVRALTRPLGDVEPVTLGVAEPFMTALRISLLAAMAISFPVLAWQGWSFVSPAWQPRIRRTVLGFAAGGSALFFTGVAFGYAIALPSAVRFLTTFDAELYDTQVRASEYLTFAAAVLLSVGLVFQLPVVLLALVRFRILSCGMMRRNRRFAYLALAVLAVVMPGVDPVTTTMWMVPLVILFEATILIAWRYERRLEREGTATETMVERLLRERAERRAEDEEPSG